VSAFDIHFFVWVTRRWFIGWVMFGASF
jgi:hypothetical protein